MPDIEDKPVLLVVDDDPESLKVLGSLLRPHAYSLAFATNGQEALECANENEPDLILLDIMMPGMDGYEVACKLKERDRTADIPIIFLTARTALEDVVSGFITGAVDYIAKPFNSPELLARVQNHIELRHAKKQLIGLNNELLSMNSQLNDLNARQQRFFGLLADDVQRQTQECRELQSYLIDAASAIDSPDFTQCADAMSKQLKRNLAFFDSLMEWGRVELSQKPPQAQPQDIQDAAAKAFQSLYSKVEARELDADNKAPQGLRAMADPEMLDTILRNLIDNAINACPKRGRVSFDAAIDAEGRLDCVVEDNGPGLSAKALCNLFHGPEGSRSQNGAPAGIGLRLARALIAMNGGEIWAESEEGEGTRLRFILPSA